jgi:putative DNA primase/helicase
MNEASRARRDGGEQKVIKPSEAEAAGLGDQLEHAIWGRREASAAPDPDPVASAGAGAAKPAPPILNANAPYDTAKEFIRRECVLAGARTWFWQGQFWRWNGKFYAPDPDEVMRRLVYEFLDGAKRWTGQNQTVRFQPTPRHVNEVLDCLKTGLALGVECQPPMWLDSPEPATECIVFGNGIVNVLTGEVRPLSHLFWAHSALGFDWRPDCPCPVWEGFLEDVFPGDAESKSFLEEWMGYCMTEETKFQKGAMLIGPKRCGKGTISHVLRRLVGDASYVGLSFNTWAESENSRECLIGKRVGVFGDVRFKPERAYGASFDPGGIGHKSAELLLNIIGEDTVTIGRKYKQPWHGQLRLKLTVIANEVLNLNDASGVLPSRFIKLPFGVSFFGREDVNLRGKLERELSGIAARCVAAYRRLCERGRFVQPTSAEALERDVLKASDPFAAMALECFVPDAGGTVVKAVAYAAFERWCRDNGRIDMLRTTSDNKLGKKLRAVAGFERLDECRPHGQPRHWVGIRLNPNRMEPG